MLIGPRALAAPPAADSIAVHSVTIKKLYCAFGGVSLIPVPTPPDFEAQFAVVVLEVDSVIATPHVAVTDFALTDGAGKTTRLKRVVSVEVFARPRVATEGIAAYYLNPGGTHPWNGTLPAGKICLRIRVALPQDPGNAAAFMIKIDGQAVAGSVDCCWPT